MKFSFETFAIVVLLFAVFSTASLTIEKKITKLRTKNFSIQWDRVDKMWRPKIWTNEVEYEFEGATFNEGKMSFYEGATMLGEQVTPSVDGTILFPEKIEDNYKLMKGQDLVGTISHLKVGVGPGSISKQISEEFERPTPTGPQFFSVKVT